MDFMKLDIQLFSDGEVEVKVTADTKDFEKGLNDIKKTTKDGFTVFKGTMANLTTDAVRMALSGMKELGSAVVNLGKQSVLNYADYEQLAGGVETLFKESADTIKKYADEAYKTAGMSANEYMETVTSFSASLIQSLGGDTKKAAEYSNRAITDMSDNANKMGTSMEMIQNAYQGFAKQNYTMLDNLKLGYGGTQEEMKRLISDASKMKDVQDELNITVNEGDMSFSNIVNSISVVQKKMGIMGTTAEEADKTISGSFNSMKSAWTNLLTGLASGDADIGKLFENLIASVQTFGSNLLPTINVLLENAMNLIREFFPKLIQELPTLWNTIIPPLLTNAMNLINLLLNSLISRLPEMIETGTDLLLGFVDSFVNNIDKVIDVAIKLIMALADGLLRALPKIVEKAPIIISKLVAKLTAPDMLNKLIQSGIALITKLAIGLIMAIPKILEGIGKIGVALASGLKNLLTTLKPSEIGKNIVKGIWSGISGAGSWIKGKVSEWCKNLVAKFKEKLKIKSPSQVMRDEIGVYMAQGVGVGFEDELRSVYADMEKSINFENAKLQGNVEMGKVFNMISNSTPITITLDANVEMDNQKVGRLVAPSVMQSVKTRGGY